jgi:hypothetical protein
MVAQSVMEPAEGGGAPLPPPGDARRDALRAREDALAEAREAAADSMGVVDRAKLRIDPEVARHFNPVTNELEVSEADPLYVYKWEQSGFHGRFIRASVTQGWEVVQGDCREALEHMGTAGDTTRRVADTILMRCRIDRHALIERRRRERQQAHESASATALRDITERHSGLGISIYETDTGMPPHIQTRMMNQAHARQLAHQQMDERIRTGRVPGMPAPGAG